MPAVDTQETLDVVVFSTAAGRFAVEARHIAALSDVATASAVDVEILLGLPAPSPAQRRCLHSAGRALRVSEPIVLRALPVDRIHPLPVLVARRMRICGACAVALEPDGATLLIDLPTLLADNASGPEEPEVHC